MSTTGVKIVKGAGSELIPLPSDHPIYKLGFVTGVIRSIDLLKAAAEKESEA